MPTAHAKYSIGVDFGTESGRAVLVRVQDGKEVATAIHTYADGVIDDVLPDGKTKLGHDWAVLELKYKRRRKPKGEGSKK